MHSLADSTILDRMASVRMPAMPQVLLQLMEMCRDDNAGIPALAALISRDAGMTSRILTVAGSSAFRRARVAPSLEQALMTIGLNMVKTLLISEAVFQIFGGFSLRRTVDLRGFWIHSLSAAITSREIAKRIGYPRLEEAYLAGLLHDVGRLALLSAEPEQYAPHFHAPDNAALCVREKELLLLNHAEAGGWIAQQWRLDSFIADSIRFHHEPETRLHRTHPLIRTVNLANQLTPGLRADAAGVTAAAQLCGLGTDDVEQLCTTAGEEIRKIAEYLGIDMATVGETWTAPAPTPEDDAREKLASHVSDLVFGASLEGCFDAGEDDNAIAAIARAACMLFGFDDAVVLMHSQADDALTGHVGAESGDAAMALSIPLQAGGMLPTAFATGKVAYQDRDGPAPTVFDEQLQRILEGGCLIAIPLSDGAACQGVLVASTGESRLPSLRARDAMLMAFGTQAGKSLGTATSGGAPLPAGEDQGTVFRSLAHEVNTPLSIIRNYLSVLDRKVSKKESVASEIAIIHEEIDRVTALINNVADPRVPAPDGQADLGAAIRDVVTLLREAEFVPPTVNIALQALDTAALEVPGDKGMLKQIFLNLVKNAVEALPGGGQIDIVCKGFTRQDNKLYLAVSVTDNGPGLPADVLARLYTPVRSTKGGNHRGLGLSIVHGLVKKLGGHMYCHSGKNGTTFELLFPYSAPSGSSPP